MSEKNMSDDIEAYLKQILTQAQQVEIRRTEIAERFNVVPSQINYVIKTRFTIQKGYLVESKRGGGGYIRIGRFTLREDTLILEELLNCFDFTLTERAANDILETLGRENLLSPREVVLMALMISQATLALGDVTSENQMRSRMIRQVLHRLRLENEGA
ncbi:transcriptional regulator CtsR [Weissella oryzae SG25]|uniref:Transcriptional regulator CtsR n=1 Tax=Weissella oryzae (strain DSM 25784 / JCM 18191 / LMG 30913 / SG25) TaxID=1329250 RepID=A0A069CRM3_WEIOS|nr:CtsR family transcriptional regulator [Weissella oryzae]GAK30017.1 transcriptional regulator CtsR [Weissella oryzae SG25]